jgi:hypothetical protein
MCVYCGCGCTKCARVGRMQVSEKDKEGFHVSTNTEIEPKHSFMRDIGSLPSRHTNHTSQQCVVTAQPTRGHTQYQHTTALYIQPPAAVHTFILDTGGGVAMLHALERSEQCKQSFHEMGGKRHCVCGAHLRASALPCQREFCGCVVNILRGGPRRLPQLRCAPLVRCHFGLVGEGAEICAQV